MESNKDEAFRCISISKCAYEEGDRTRAQRFLSKARRLYPDLKVNNSLFAFIEDVRQKTTENDQSSESVCREISKEDNESKGASKNNENYGCRQRNSSSTIEFSEVVHNIRKSTDYYEILGLQRDCSQTEVRKAFRKLSLKVHPDKNKYPGAEEAFKAVSAAFNCLSNPEQREKYDNQNLDEVHDYSYEQYTGQYNSYEYCNETSETFANFFFKMNQQNAGFQGPNFFRPHKTRGDATIDSVNRTRILHFVGLVQLLAIVMLILVSLMPNTYPSFSMNKDASYQYECLTNDHGVSFFVKRPDFQQKYPPGSNIRKNIDDLVEKNYKEMLAHNCRVEVGLRMWGRTEETPSCDALRQFTV